VSVPGALAGCARKFLELWRTETRGDAYPATLFAGSAAEMRLEAERRDCMARLFRGTVGFAAAKIIRRILKLAHNIDFESIDDGRLRAVYEARRLSSRAMPVDTASFATIGEVTKRAAGLRDRQPDFNRGKELMN
jgi:5-methylthioribose kinase